MLLDSVHVMVGGSRFHATSWVPFLGASDLGPVQSGRASRRTSSHSSPSRHGTRLHGIEMRQFH